VDNELTLCVIEGRCGIDQVEVEPVLTELRGDKNELLPCRVSNTLVV
jgi:hypothetical protein